MPIIALAGPAFSGKDTVGRIIQAEMGDAVKLIAFAEPIKRFCREVFDWTDEHTNGALKLVPDTRYPRTILEHPWRLDADNGMNRKWTCTRCLQTRGTGGQEVPPDETCTTYLDPRTAMQHVGTEGFRALYADVWAVLGVRKAVEWLEEPLKGYAIQIADSARQLAHARRVAVITDTRFLNEARLVKAAGGEVWFMARDGGAAGGIAGHASEMELQSDAFQAEVDVRIANHGTIAHLMAQVHERLFELRKAQ